MLLNLPKQRKEMIKEMMEEAMELVETNQKSISGVRFTRAGSAYEKYVTENSAELIATSKQ